MYPGEHVKCMALELGWSIQGLHQHVHVICAWHVNMNIGNVLFLDTFLYCKEMLKSLDRFVSLRALFCSFCIFLSFFFFFELTKALDKISLIEQTLFFYTSLHLYFHKQKVSAAGIDKCRIIATYYVTTLSKSINRTNSTNLRWWSAKCWKLLLHFSVQSLPSKIILTTMK